MHYFHAGKRLPGWLIPLVIFLVILTVFLYGTGTVSGRNIAREKESLQNALSRDITDCYAYTGRYPESLEQIKSRYGLTYDESRFFVDYRVIGANLRPTVVVLERGNAH